MGKTAVMPGLKRTGNGKEQGLGYEIQLPIVVIIEELRNSVIVKPVMV